VELTRLCGTLEKRAERQQAQSWLRKFGRRVERIFSLTGGLDSCCESGAKMTRRDRAGRIHLRSRRRWLWQPERRRWPNWLSGSTLTPTRSRHGGTNCWRGRPWVIPLDPRGRLVRLVISVFAEAGRRHEAAVPRRKPTAPVRARDLADVGDRLAVKLQWPRHAPARNHQFVLTIHAVAHDRRELVGEDAGERRHQGQHGPTPRLGSAPVSLVEVVSIGRSETQANATRTIPSSGSIAPDSERSSV
jgi:hypothetical protein